MDSFSAWSAAYDSWLERATNQFKDEHRDLFNDGGHLEICEDGSVYLGNLMWLPPGAVEPWSE